MIHDDSQRCFLQRIYASIMRVYITERFEYTHDGKPDSEHAGEQKAAVTTPKELSILAEVCKLWHEELQLHRNRELAAAVAHFINVAPVQAIALVNVDMYTAVDWAGMPLVTRMALSVHLGSREVFYIAIERMRARRDAKAHELSIGCCVSKSKDGKPCSSPDLVMPVHALCSKSGGDFTEADMVAYDAWHNATLADVRAWLQGEYEKMTAAV